MSGVLTGRLFDVASSEKYCGVYFWPDGFGVVAQHDIAPYGPCTKQWILQKLEKLTIRKNL